MENVEKNSINQFNQWAKDYDKKRFWTFYFSNKAVANTLDPKQGTSVLDVGCGTGILLQQLVKLNRKLKLYGVDIAPEMVRATKLKLGENAAIQEGSANKLPYKNNTFDYVTCSTSFHHHPNSLNSLKEMYRVLKLGGKLVLLDMCVDGIFRKALAKIDNVVNKKGTTFIYTKEQMKRLFEKVGYKSIRQKHHWYFSLIMTGEK